MINGRQIRAARGFLAWDRRDLANKAVVALHIIERLEASAERTSAAMNKALTAIKATFEAEGIEFTSDASLLGVQLQMEKAKARSKGK